MWHVWTCFVTETFSTDDVTWRHVIGPNYSDISWVSWRLKSMATRLFIQHMFSLWQKKYQSLCYWSFVRGIHRWSVDSPHKGPVTYMYEALPFHNAIMSFGSDNPCRPNWHQAIVTRHFRSWSNPILYHSWISKNESSIDVLNDRLFWLKIAHLIRLCGCQDSGAYHANLS